MAEAPVDRSRIPVSRGLRILFVGNSLTYRGGGLDNHFRSIVPGTVTERVVKGGASLDRLLRLAGERIAESQWDIVVLQDDLPETTVENFLAAAGKGIRMVREAGARPLLLMTWPYKRLDWIDASGIAEAHRKAAIENKTEVIPAGEAWAASLRDRPDIELYDSDREHPSEIGSLLAACTMAASLGYLRAETRGSDSPGEDERPSGLTPDEFTFLVDTAITAAGNWR